MDSPIIPLSAPPLAFVSSADLHAMAERLCALERWLLDKEGKVIARQSCADAARLAVRAYLSARMGVNVEETDAVHPMGRLPL